MNSKIVSTGKEEAVYEYFSKMVHLSPQILNHCFSYNIAHAIKSVQYKTCSIGSLQSCAHISRPFYLDVTKVSLASRSEHGEEVAQIEGNVLIYTTKHKEQGTTSAIDRHRR